MQGQFTFTPDQMRVMRIQLDCMLTIKAKTATMRLCPNCSTPVIADTEHGMALCGFCGHGPVWVTREAAAAAAAIDVSKCPVCKCNPTVAELGSCRGCYDDIAETMAAANGQAAPEVNRDRTD